MFSSSNTLIWEKNKLSTVPGLSGRTKSRTGKVFVIINRGQGTAWSGQLIPNPPDSLSHTGNQ